MRVALVGDYPKDPNRIMNGPQAVFAYLVNALRLCPDLELNVVTAHKSPTDLCTFQRDGVAFHYLGYPRLPSELSYPIMRRSIHRVLRRIKPDLVHGQSTLRHGCIALGAGFPTVLVAHNVHGTEARFAPRTINRLRFRLHDALMRRYFVANVRHLVSINKYVRESYEGVVNATFYDIPNPIADAFFSLDPNRETLNLVLFVGLLRARKRPDLAVEAFAIARQEVPDLALHFAGAAIEPALKAKMDQYIADHNLSGSVRFLGHLTESLLLEAYQRASIVLLTSDLETSPMAIQQAMAAGKAVVATAAGGVPFLIDDGRTGLVVERNNPEQIAQALVRLIENPGLRKQIGRKARSVALSRFRGEVVAQKIHAMYEEILNASRN